MAIQTSVADDLGNGRNGMIATGEPFTTVSRVSAGTGTNGADPIPFGRAVSQEASNANGFSLGVAGGGSTPFNITEFVGITVRDRTQPVRADDKEGYRKGASSTLLTKGVIWVQVDGAVTVGADVTINDTSGELGTKTASATQTLLPRARWLDAAADNGLARVSIDTSQIGA